MVRLILFLLLLNCCHAEGRSSGFYVPKARQLNTGLDLSQFNYLADPFRRAPNAGVFAQYKPYYLLALNAGFIYNNVRSQRSQGFQNLQDYHSRGLCMKLGFDLSVRISKRRRDTRAFIGYQSSFVHYKESGSFVIPNYWGAHVSSFETGWHSVHAREMIFGFQFARNRWILRTQFYAVFARDDNRISYNDAVLSGYRSPFIPGLGYRRGGLNLIILYKLRR